MRRLLIALSLLVPLASCGSNDEQSTALPEGCAAADGSSPVTRVFTEYPPDCLKLGAKYSAEIATNFGNMQIDLYAGTAPLAVNSFVNLARFHFYDNSPCHSGRQDFVVRCGDPSGSGSGGPGYFIADEIIGQDPYDIGAIAMTNSGPNTGGSQFFFITGKEGVDLPPTFTLFGHVQKQDMGVLGKLNSLTSPDDGAPLKPITILSVTINEN